MKKLLTNPRGLWILLAALTVGMVGCKDDDREVPTLATLTVSYDGTSYNDLTINNIPVSGTTYTIGVESNRNWTISVPTTETKWVDVDPTSGVASETATSVKIEVYANPDNSRNLILTLRTSDGSLERKITLIQAGSDTPGADAIFFEDIGDFKTGAQIRSVSGIGDGWPTISQFGAAEPTNSWRRGGDIDQSGVEYSGTGSVRNSGVYWDSDPQNSSSSTAPYIYQSGSNAQTFMINGINLGGNTNLTFSWIMQDTANSTQNDSGAYVPDTNPITSSTINVEAGFNGSTYAALPITIGSVIGNGWTNASAEFKVPSGTDKLYIKFSGFSGSQGLRMDNFTLSEGGNGSLIEPEPAGDSNLGKGLISISDLVAEFESGEAIPDNTLIAGTIISDAANKNFSSPGISIILMDSEDPNSGMYIYQLRDDDGNILTVDQSFTVGQNVQVDLSGANMTIYSGLREITDVKLSNVTSTTLSNTYDTPIEVTAADMDNYQSMLVKVNGTPTSSVVGTTWNGTKAFTDTNNTEFVVYTTSGATFSSDVIPAGSGSITGIVGYYSGTAQLMPRNLNDIDIDTGTPYFTVNTQSVNVSANGGTASVNVSSNVDWTAAVTAGAANITSGPTPDNGNGSGTISLVFHANTDTDNTKTVTLRVSTTESVNPQYYDVVFTQAAAPSGAEPTYSLVTSTAQITAGEYLFVGTQAQAYYTMNTQSSSNYVTVVDIADYYSGGVFTDTDGSLSDHAVTLATASDGDFTIQLLNQYLYANSDSSNQLQSRANNDDKNSEWKISIETDDDSLLANVVAQGDNSRNDMRFNYNNGTNSRFACYDGNVTNVPKFYIYKKN